MSKCITKADYQTYTAKDNFMVLFGSSLTDVYHFENWNHPGGWDSTVGRFAGKIQDMEPDFTNGGSYGGHSLSAKNYLKGKKYGYLANGDDCPVVEGEKSEIK